jgi:RNA polymerase sigma factor (sigma-70 family)
MAIAEDRLEEVIAIDEALTRLAEWSPRQSNIVVLRFFGGLTEGEIADVLGIARRTVTREWDVARAWLHGELSEPQRFT